MKSVYSNGVETEEHRSGVKITFTTGTLLRMKDSVRDEIDDLANNLDDINSRISKANASRTESQT